MSSGANNRESVEQFKQFVKKHPKLVSEVREGKHTWKEFYEDWYIFGEDDEMWVPYKKHSNEQYKKKQTTSPNTLKESSKSHSNAEFIGQLMNMIKNVDMNQLQYHITNVSGALANIQQLMEQFQSNNQQNSHHPPRRDPFSFKKD